MIKIVAKPTPKKSGKATEAVVAAPRTPSGQYKLTEPGKDFRLIKGGWPSSKKDG